METAVRTEIAEKRRPSVIKRLLAVLLVTALLLAAAGYGGLYVLLKGPSVYAGDLFTAALADSTPGNAILRLFLTPEEITSRQQSAQEQIPDQNGSGTEQLFSVYPQLG